MNTLLGNYATLTALSASTPTNTLNTLLSDKQDVVTNVSDVGIRYLDGVQSGIQSQIDSKQNTLTAGSNIQISNNAICIIV